ncbi:MAG: hypothetical protein L6R38_003441 [Xanthoria sp. 2 TBL-2021]|nr:MAG: hypothetical protein L6R38_003441 [Xanthoria sp. 2 TBL-2021]
MPGKPDVPYLEDVIKATQKFQDEIEEKNAKTEAVIEEGLRREEYSPEGLNRKQHLLMEHTFGKSFENCGSHVKTQMTNYLLAWVPRMVQIHGKSKIWPAGDREKDNVRGVASYQFMKDVWFPATDFDSLPLHKDTVQYWRLKLFHSKTQPGFEFFCEQVQSVLDSLL